MDLSGMNPAARSTIGCDTARVARKLRQIERVEFTATEHSRLDVFMSRLADAEDGWINLIPKITDVEEKPTSLGFFTLIGGGGTGVTMCTWIPGSHDQGDHDRTSLGITHVTGRRAAAELVALGHPIPESWLVEQDHPRRGLVLTIPSGEPHEKVLSWALRAVGALSAPRQIARWRADVYLPAAP
jgi:hypothetical protein